MIGATTALILAGGQGSRIAALHPDLPKPLIPIAGHPFLHWLISWLRTQGFSHFVFSTGYKGDKIREWLADAPLKGITYEIHQEETSLGTGGAVRACLPLCRDSLAVINGDSLTLTSLAPAAAQMENSAIDGVILGKYIEDAGRYGTLIAGKDGILRSFRDKQPGAGIISTGILFIRRNVLEVFPEQNRLSMEDDIIPQLIARGARLMLHQIDRATPFIDIGTPESLAEADSFIENHKSAF